MAGFDLKEGMYEARNVSDDELWSAFACVFSSKSRNDSSYKFGFLKAIIDNLYNVDANLKLSFDQLFNKFGEIYWNLILKYGLRQKAVTNDNRETYLEQVLHAAVEKYKILEPIPYESLTAEMMLDISHQVKMKCKKYVVGALFEDTNRLFYSFSKKEEWIQINPVMYEFVCKHKVIIEKLNYYEWARFLERVNEETVAVKLLNKIDESTKRCNRKKNDKLPAGDYLAALVHRNQHILIEAYRPEMKNYQERMVRYVYNWAKINGYDKIWQPERRKVLV